MCKHNVAKPQSKQRKAHTNLNWYVLSLRLSLILARNVYSCSNMQLRFFIFYTFPAFLLIATWSVGNGSWLKTGGAQRRWPKSCWIAWALSWAIPDRFTGPIWLSWTPC